MDVLAILLGHQLPLEFPPGVRAAAERVGRRGVRPEDVAGREDFRDCRVVTIDPADARDHDDALHVRALENGDLEVGVHIADVSWYVKRGSELDREALERGTSVYLVDRVVPMLPEEISAGLCSLVPNEDRLTLSVVFRAMRDGDLRDAKIVRGVIRSRHRLSYEQAQSLLDGQVPSPAPGDDREWGALRDDLRLLDGLARAVRGRRARAGAVDFAVPEARVRLDERGEPVEIHPRARLEAHRLIEDLMILANETVAGIGENEELPLVYRIHEKPDPERIEALRGIVRVLGRDLPQDDVRPKDIARLIEAFEDRPQRALVSTVALRSMKQARYSVHNVGHFGLASEAYVHFTSPIRRYPDLAVHREIVRWLEGRARPGEDPERLEPVARLCSERERRAAKAERDSVDAKKVRYMLQHLGDQFTGTISGVTGFGLFVLLDEVLVDGLVRVSSMVDDYYVLDEEAFALIGRRTRRRLRLGDRVEVRVARVDPEAREVDLELLEGPLDVA
jgi:ribonuclease R